MSRTSKNRIYLNQDEIIALNDFMRTVCTSVKEGDKKIATYTVPWNDASVAKHVKASIPHLLESHVYGFRQRVFGEIRRAPKMGRPSTNLVARVDALEAKLAKLRAWAENMDPGTNFDA